MNQLNLSPQLVLLDPTIPTLLTPIITILNENKPPEIITINGSFNGQCHRSLEKNNKSVITPQ